jgi:ERCC4-type nuclease
MKILVDTREQTPFWKGANVCRRCCLKEGDYTTELLLNVFHIERKSLQDLYGTLIHNHPRFRREILRAEERGLTLVVVVEGSYKDFVNKNFPRGHQRKTPTTTLKKIVATVKRRYELEIIFCGSRDKAKKKTFERLHLEERKRKRTIFSRS